MSDENAMVWMDRVDRSIMAMKGRPLSEKQRAAVIGVLLTLDPSSPFYVPMSDESQRAFAAGYDRRQMEVMGALV